MIRFCRLLVLLLPVILLSAVQLAMAAELPSVVAPLPKVAPGSDLRGPADRAALLRWREQMRTRGAKAQVAANTSVNVPAGIISTFAGAVPFQQPSTALNTSIGDVSGMAEDASGNLFVSAYDFRSVQKIDPAGNVTVYARMPLPVGPLQATGDGGPATAATLVDPQGLAVDAAGNLYIADFGSRTVRMVTAATGIITTVAGTPGVYGSSPDGTVATSAKLSGPESIAVDAGGDLFLFDNDAVREVTRATGLLSTVAGSVEYPDPTCMQLSATQTCAATTVELAPLFGSGNITINGGTLYICVNGVTTASQKLLGSILAIQLSSGTM